MEEINNVAANDHLAGLTRRLRVDISGLSAETRRQLGLVVGDKKEPIPAVHGEGESKGEDSADRLTGPSQSRASRGDFDKGTERGGAAEREQTWPTNSFDAAPAARVPMVEKQLSGGQAREQSSAGSETFAGAASPLPEPGRVDEPAKAGNELVNEGNHPSLAGNLTLLRPGRARSGDGETRGNQLLELQAAVSQHTARNQQMFGTLLQALRDAAQGQAVHRAELGRLASQLRTLAAQNASAGFNRQ
jgi:hypothetical protein